MLQNLANSCSDICFIYTKNKSSDIQRNFALCWWLKLCLSVGWNLLCKELTGIRNWKGRQRLLFELKKVENTASVQVFMLSDYLFLTSSSRAKNMFQSFDPIFCALVMHLKGSKNVKYLSKNVVVECKPIQIKPKAMSVVCFLQFSLLWKLKIVCGKRNSCLLAKDRDFVKLPIFFVPFPCYSRGQ